MDQALSGDAKCFFHSLPKPEGGLSKTPPVLEALFAAAKAGKFGEKFKNSELYERTDPVLTDGFDELSDALKSDASDELVVALVSAHPEAGSRMLTVIETWARMAPAFVRKFGHDRHYAVIQRALRTKIEIDCLNALTTHGRRPN